MARKTRNIAITDETLDIVAEIFIEHDVLNKHGLSFVAFIEEWKLGKEEQYI